MKSIAFRIFFGICLVNIKTIVQLFFGKDAIQNQVYFDSVIWFFQIGGYFLFLSGMYLIYEHGQNTRLNQSKLNLALTHSSNQDKQPDEKIYENNKTIVKINAIISEISNLQQEFKNKNLDLDIFIKFNLLHDKFKMDLQTTQDVVSQLQVIGQNDNPSHVKLLDHYLDLFNEQKQIIYHHIQQQCNEEFDKMNNQLHNFNEMMDKIV